MLRLCWIHHMDEVSDSVGGLGIIGTEPAETQFGQIVQPVVECEAGHEPEHVHECSLEHGPASHRHVHNVPLVELLLVGEGQAQNVLRKDGGTSRSPMMKV